MATKEWDYILSKDELYFTSKYRFPIQSIVEISSYPSSSNSLIIIIGFVMLLLSLIIPTSTAVKILIAVVAVLLIVWGIYNSRKIEVGFVVLKDSKRHEKEFIPVLTILSKKTAEEKLISLHKELEKIGHGKVRITRNY